MQFCHLQHIYELGGHYVKWNKSYKSKYYIISLTYGFQKIHKIVYVTKKKHTNVENKLVFTSVEKDGVGQYRVEEWDVKTVKCKIN